MLLDGAVLPVQDCRRGVGVYRDVYRRMLYRYRAVLVLSVLLTRDTLAIARRTLLYLHSCQCAHGAEGISTINSIFSKMDSAWELA